MSRYRNVIVNGRPLRARAGDVLLDAALSNGIDMPHDCRAGSCGSCMVRIAKGRTLGGQTHTPGMVHACQARVLSDLVVEVEDVPEVGAARARLVGLRELAPDIFELKIAPESSLCYLPGQYFRFAFAGYPARAYSATAAMDGRIGGRLLHLNVKRVRGGRVTSAIGRAIRCGHRIRMEGPFGHAFLRPGGKGRLVLAASGTGFAPVWAIACAALRENKARRIALIAGSRRLAALYMRPALGLVARLPNVTVVPTIEEGPSPYPTLRVGRVEDHLPRLEPSDTVYACGSPRMVEALAGRVERAGATFFADPFETTPPEQPANLLDMLKAIAGARRGHDQADALTAGLREPLSSG